MDAMVRMDRSVDTVVNDLEILLRRTRELKKEISAIEVSERCEGHVFRINELLADLQARVEGIESFIKACRIRAHREEPPAEDIDLWM